MSRESAESPLRGVVVPSGTAQTPDAAPEQVNASAEVVEAPRGMMTLDEARHAIDRMLEVQVAGITSEASFAAAFGDLAPALMVFGPHIVNNTEATTGNSRSISPKEYKKASWEDERGAEQLVVMWPRDILNKTYSSPHPTDEEIGDVQSRVPANEVHVYTNRFMNGREQSEFDLTMFGGGVLGPHLQVGYTPAKGGRVDVEIKQGEPRQSHEYSLAAKGTLHTLRVLRSRDQAIMREQPALAPGAPQAITNPRK